MIDLIFWIIFFILLLCFIDRFPILTFMCYKKPIESLSMRDIASSQKNKCGCDEIKSLNNLLSQYNILNNKIETNSTTISTLQKDFNQAKINIAQNKVKTTKINGLIQEVQKIAADANKKK